jgi:hypothetical protein
MSAIATTYLIKKEKLPELKEKAGAGIKVKKGLFGRSKENTDLFPTWFAANTTELMTLGYSGFVFNSVLTYLDQEKAIDIINPQMKELSDDLSEKRPFLMNVYVLEDRERFLDKLEPSNFSSVEIAKFSVELNEEGVPEEACAAAIKMLHESFQRIDANNAMIFYLY